MKKSTFDTIVSSYWESHGSVTFTGLATRVRDAKGQDLRAGFYPCFGVTFKPEPFDDQEVERPAVYWWDGKRVKNLKHSPLMLRRLMLKIVHNPSVAEADALRYTIRNAIAADPTKQSEDYPPHVRLDDAFVAAFNDEAFYFTEVAHDLLVSQPLTLGEINIWERDGSSPQKPGDVEKGPFEIVLHMTHVEDPQFGDVMMMTSRWTKNGAELKYMSTYGCCRA